MSTTGFLTEFFLHRYNAQHTKIICFFIHLYCSQIKRTFSSNGSLKIAPQIIAPQRMTPQKNATYENCPL